MDGSTGDEREAERLALVRQVRQRLESLRRAGLSRFPDPPVLAKRRMASPVEAAAVGPEPSPPAAAVAPPVTRPTPAALPVEVPAASLFDDVESQAPAVAPADRERVLAALAEQVSRCVKCPHLAATRTQTVFGVGSPNARLMFIGEAPGADEDRTGVPFVGRAGALLTDMITKGMGLSRDDVFIANILKCRPPENRNPEPPEVANCRPYLERQIEVIKPEFLCLLGKVPASVLLDTALPLARLRGKWHRVYGIPTIVTYHPAYLLRVPADKKKSWEDLQILMQAMGITPPSRRKAQE